MPALQTGPVFGTTWGESTDHLLHVPTRFSSHRVDPGELAAKSKLAAASTRLDHHPKHRLARSMLHKEVFEKLAPEPGKDKINAPKRDDTH